MYLLFFYCVVFLNKKKSFKCTDLFLIYSLKMWQIPHYTVNYDFMT